MRNTENFDIPGTADAAAAVRAAEHAAVRSASCAPVGQTPVAAPGHARRVGRDIMLLFARPFTIGDELTIRSGALAGPIIGRVNGMTLTYIMVLTTAGPVLVPDSSVLAAAVGPASE